MFFKSFIISKKDCISNNKKQKGIDNSAIQDGKLSKLPVVLPLTKES